MRKKEVRGQSNRLTFFFLSHGSRPKFELECLSRAIPFRSYQALGCRIEEALKEKHCLERVVQKEEARDQKIEELTNRLKTVKQTRALEVGKRKKRLAFLKNELQELKAKTRMEDSFLLKSTNAEGVHGGFVLELISVVFAVSAL